MWHLSSTEDFNHSSCCACFSVLFDIISEHIVSSTELHLPIGFRTPAHCISIAKADRQKSNIPSHGSGFVRDSRSWMENLTSTPFSIRLSGSAFISQYRISPGARSSASAGPFFFAAAGVLVSPWSSFFLGSAVLFCALEAAASFFWEHVKHD